MNEQLNLRLKTCASVIYRVSLSTLGVAMLCGCSRKTEPALSAHQVTFPTVRTGEEAVTVESSPTVEAELGSELNSTGAQFVNDIPSPLSNAAASGRVGKASTEPATDASHFSGSRKEASTKPRVETSPLLEKWSGDITVLPAAELIDEGWDSLTTLASEGVAEAQFRLGLLMLTTKPTGSRIFEQLDGLDWIRKAAEGGHTLAASELAGCYLEGALVEVDFQEAERLFDIGASAGDAKCLWGAGYLKFQRGDIETGLELIRNAAEAGAADAQVALGEFYLEGNHLERNLEEAKSWYLKAAKQGHVLGQYNLGTMAYMAGNVIDAKLWLTRAADQNHADAAQNLAALYFDEGELYQAERYVNLAIRLGNYWATQMRTGIKRQQQLEQQIQDSIYSTGFSGY
ncbi:MAG: sel1 repeat family protein [Planctomycetales bacterium]|nr:sel1 repeat family protein [Planctomycetales bacterium]